MFKIKDGFGLSNSRYHLMRNKLNLKKELPTLYLLIQLKENIDNQYRIETQLNAAINRMHFKFEQILTKIAKKLGYLIKKIKC